MAVAFLSIGTNIGNKRGNLTEATGLLAERVGDILALSSMYETEPWGFQSENSFLNAALILVTKLTPEELLNATRLIEIEMGRIEKSHGSYHDRIIDIDILMYGDLIMQTDTLTIPHPHMHKRLFVMQPLAEIAPEAVHPVLHKTMEEIVAECSKG
ncbi:2-amino-4-hydroxy-6-hydroxymethyldihydropteridine diphosphokinase [Parabacteroides sp. PFB2-10]|uniref:2-amino-4-hydroxy-6- hydroxymethyldihydropteridine diphosphokinase n=1 Tax=Parabacteroides sp. PFB2-10 TaxID=1742405 RepID=UPI0024766A64|nr:2-amino-4-hydroxy-6-hydroxymethyldihydropteridine diphosphokinase [Parabacteroides sp. PFB2-10]MDH6311622.1 2-amino-4-hydroxy-6-hydroxymethyldihydropteridine diphosphokinase [Parabacteroides sp. PFB2-10]